MDNFEFDSSLIEPIISFLDTGINKFLPAVLILASLIAVIDGLWSYFQYHATKDVSSIMSKVVVKWVRYAFTFGIIKIYIGSIIPMAYKIFTGIGNSFGEGFGNPLKVQNVWNKGWESVNRMFELSGKIGGLWGFVYIIFSVIAFLCLVFILSSMTMAILSFHVVVRLAVIFLAFIPFEVMTDIGRKTLTSIVNSGTDLMTCVALSSMCFSVMQEHPFPTTVTENTNSPQVMGIWLCVWVVSAFLVVSYEKISSLIISGQGGLTGADLGRYTAGVVATAGIVTGKGIEMASKGVGKSMQKIGETWSSGKDAGSKGAGILEKAGSMVERAGTETAKRTDQTAKGAAKAIETITGNLNPQESIAGAIRNSSIGNYINPGEKEEEEEKNSFGNETAGENRKGTGTEKAEGRREDNQKFEEEKKSESQGETRQAEKVQERKGSSYSKNRTANTERAKTNINNENLNTNNGNRENASYKENNRNDAERYGSTENIYSSENTVSSEGTSSTANRTADTQKTEEAFNSETFTEVHDTGTDYSNEKKKDGTTEYSENIDRRSEKRTTENNYTSKSSFSDREIKKEKEIKTFAETALENEKNSGKKET
ncbi:MAG: type IV secretion system protein [Leptotrichia sp.]|nr:type IV secretion system protein [Leptotrichia sp.]